MIGLMLGLFQVSIGYIPRTTPTEHSHRCCQILAAEDTAEELVSSGIHSEKLDWNGSNFGNMSNSSLNNSKCMSFNSFCVSCLQSIHYTVCVWVEKTCRLCQGKIYGFSKEPQPHDGVPACHCALDLSIAFSASVQHRSYMCWTTWWKIPRNHIHDVFLNHTISNNISYAVMIQAQAWFVETRDGFRKKYI